MSCISTCCQERMQRTMTTIRNCDLQGYLAITNLISTVALTLIAFLAAFGVFPSATFAGGSLICTVSIWGVSLISSFLIQSEKLSGRDKLMIVFIMTFSACMITIGALGCSGTLAVNEIGRILLHSF